jgi:hypothetical protein
VALLRRREADEPERPTRLRDGVESMRAALDALHGGERRAPDLRRLTEDLLTGEVAAPTRDVAWLVREGPDPRRFYEKEIAPSWEGLDQTQRAARLDGFLELAEMADTARHEAALPRDAVATIHVKTLVLAWAFDRVHGYLGEIAAAGPGAPASEALGSPGASGSAAGGSSEARASADENSSN